MFVRVFQFQLGRRPRNELDDFVEAAVRSLTFESGSVLPTRDRRDLSLNLRRVIAVGLSEFCQGRFEAVELLFAFTRGCRRIFSVGSRPKNWAEIKYFHH